MDKIKIRQYKISFDDHFRELTKMVEIGKGYDVVEKGN